MPKIQLVINRTSQQLTIPNKNIMERAATMDNPAPDNDASVKSLGIFLLTKVNNNDKNNMHMSIPLQKRKSKTKSTYTCIPNVGVVKIHKIINNSQLIISKLQIKSKYESRLFSVSHTNSLIITAVMVEL